MIIWITSLSGAGKTTLAKALYKHVKKKFPNTLWIDGDIIRRHFRNTKKFDQKSRIDQYKKMIRLAKFCYEQKINIAEVGRMARRHFSCPVRSSGYFIPASV